MPDSRPHPALRVLHDQIAGRCNAVMAGHAAWPCRKGCDLCCRRLAQLPECTAAEWELVELGIEQLSPPARDRIANRLSQPGGTAPFTCPFLDDSGECSIYAYRPVACRTYGFYLERGEGRYCSIIRDRVDSEQFSDVVWGNYETIESRLDAFGPRISLLDRFRNKI